MHEEERRDKRNDDQDFEDQTFEAMRKAVNISDVQMSSGSASSSDGAQVYWDKDGVWDEYGGLVEERCQWMVAQVAWMKNSVLHVCQSNEDFWVLSNGLRPLMHARTHIRGNSFFFVVCVIE